MISPSGVRGRARFARRDSRARGSAGCVTRPPRHRLRRRIMPTAAAITATMSSSTIGLSRTLPTAVAAPARAGARRNDAACRSFDFLSSLLLFALLAVSPARCRSGAGRDPACRGGGQRSRAVSLAGGAEDADAPATPLGAALRAPSAGTHPRPGRPGRSPASTSEVSAASATELAVPRKVIRELVGVEDTDARQTVRNQVSFNHPTTRGATLVAAADDSGRASRRASSIRPGYAAASIVIWAAVIAGLVSRALPTGRVSRLAAAAGLCIAGYGGSGRASRSAGRAIRDAAFDEAVRVSFYLGLFVLAVCTGTRRDRTEWLAGLTIGLGAGRRSWRCSPTCSRECSTAGGSDVPNAAGRLSYPVGYWNAAGALLAVAAVLLSYAGARAPTRALALGRDRRVPTRGPRALADELARRAGSPWSIGLVILIAASPDRSRQLVAVVVGAVGAAVADRRGRTASATSRSAWAHSAMRPDGDLMSVVGGPGRRSRRRRARLVGRWPQSEAARLHGGRAVISVRSCLPALVVGVVAADPSKRLHEFEKPPPTRAGMAVDAADLSSNGRWQFWGEAHRCLRRSNPLDGVGAGGYRGLVGAPRHGRDLRAQPALAAPPAGLRARRPGAAALPADSSSRSRSAVAGAASRAQGRRRRS